MKTKTITLTALAATVALGAMAPTLADARQGAGRISLSSSSTKMATAFCRLRTSKPQGLSASR